MDWTVTETDGSRGPALAAELDLPGASGLAAALRIAVIFCALIQGRPDWPHFAFHGW